MAIPVPTLAGGYDYEFVDPVPDDYTCPICTLVQREAHQVTCCGKIYCLSCLEQLKKKRLAKYECPSCRSSLEGDRSFFPDKNAVSKIKHLKIYCHNKERGCQWKGQLVDFSAHQYTCPNEIVQCTNNNYRAFSLGGQRQCPVKLERCQLQKHTTQECDYRIIPCQYCYWRGMYMDKAIHEDICPNMEVNCTTEGCDVKVKRCLLSRHLNTCPKQVISCQYKSVGCRERFKRETEGEHNQQFIQHHLDIAMTQLDDVLAERGSHDCHVIRLVATNDTRVFYDGKSKYKLALDINKVGDDTYHLSISVLPGRYDHALKWPGKGRVSLSILNQQRDENHKGLINNNVRFNQPTATSPVVVISRDITVNEENYIADNIMIFRLEVNLPPPAKSWLLLTN